MPHYRYLIVGGGMTADAAVRGIRSVDERGSVGVVSEEPDPPYDRPPLSKGLWKPAGDDAVDDPAGAVDRDTASLGADLHLEHRVLRIDPEDHTVTGDRGVVYTYDKLLLATGGRPVELEDGTPQVNYFRTLEDYRRLRKVVDGGGGVAVVGGGFIGSEIAASLCGLGVETTLLFPEEGIVRNVFPADISGHLTELYRSRGVDVRPGAGVASVRRSGDRLLVATEEGDPSDTIQAASVVAGLGIVPNQELAATAGLDVVEMEEGGGIEVDERLRTSAPDIWAAGDVASVWFPALGKRMRVEHEDQANSSGRQAGRCMAGAEEEYDHLPYFYSDLFDVGYEAVGELDPALDVAPVWEDEYEKGILYYLEDRRIRGVLFWNAPGKLKEARALVRSGEKRSRNALPGLISLS